MASQIWLNSSRLLPESGRAVRAAAKAAYNACCHNEERQNAQPSGESTSHTHRETTHPQNTTPPGNQPSLPASETDLDHDTETAANAGERTRRPAPRRTPATRRTPGAQETQNEQCTPAHAPRQTMPADRTPDRRHSTRGTQDTHVTRANSTTELNTAARHTSQTGECTPGTDVTTFSPWLQETFIDAAIGNKRSRKKRARTGHKILIAETYEGLIDDREEWRWTDLGRRPHECYKWLYYSGKHKGRRPPPAPLRGGTGGNPSGVSVFQHSPGVSAPT